MMNMRHLAMVVTIGLGLFVTFAATQTAQAITTTDTQFLLNPALQLAAYGWQLDDPAAPLSPSNPLVIQYLQLYNAGDEPIDSNNWKLYLQDSLGVRTALFLTGGNGGLVEPHKHVTASFGGSVSGATYSLAEIPLPSLTQTVKAKIVIAPTTDGVYLEDEYELKSSALFWQRNFSSTGVGYVSTFTGSAIPPEQLADDGLYVAPGEPKVTIDELYAYSSDCAPNDISALCGDYIKLHVDNNAQDLSLLRVRTDSNSSSSTTSNTFYLADYAVSDDGYMTIMSDQNGKRLALNNSGGYVWVEDLYGQVIYETTMTKYDSATSDHQGWSWMLDTDEIWKWTSTPQPGVVNKLTIPVEVVKALACPAGKYLNPDTNRCRTIEEAVNALATCPEGQERNPTTNRCRSKVLASNATLAPCSEGQERNPSTNRCRSIASAVAELIPCDEGYERNPATNRCRKVVEAVLGSSGAGDPAKLVEQAQGGNWSVWTWALIAVGATGAIGYGVYEWRSELGSLSKKVVMKLGKK